LVEQSAVNRLVAGSSPARGAIAFCRRSPPLVASPRRNYDLLRFRRRIFDFPPIPDLSSPILENNNVETMLKPEGQITDRIFSGVYVQMASALRHCNQPFPDRESYDSAPVEP
jgi:hypothetical protein